MSDLKEWLNPLLPAENRVQIADGEIDRLCAQLAASEARAEQSDVLTDDMLRYAMAALGTNSPADADLYRAFWLHAITARKSNTALAEGGPRWADGGDAMAGAMAGM